MHICMQQLQQLHCATARVFNEQQVRHIFAFRFGDENMCCSCACVSFFFGSGGRRAAHLGRSLCVSGAGVTALTVLVAISQESKNSCFHRNSWKVAPSMSECSQQACTFLLLCCRGHFPVRFSTSREQIPKRAHTV